MLKELLVPERDKNKVLENGGIQKENNMWDIPEENEIFFLRWFKTKNDFDYLYIDLIPKTTFFVNLRALLSIKQWDYIKKETYLKANYKCEICGGVGFKHPVETHERWTYDFENKVQKIRGLIALCPKCHLATHIGLAEVLGKKEEIKKHIKKVNNWDEKQYIEHEKNAISLWQKRNKVEWVLDIELIKKMYPEIF